MDFLVAFLARFLALGVVTLIYFISIGATLAAFHF